MGRIDTIGASIVDEEIQSRLGLLRDQLSAAAVLLRDPTDANLTRVDDRIHYVTQQLDLLTKRPKRRRRGPYNR